MLRLWLGATATDILDSILESITDEFYACDRQWRLIYLNDAAVTAIRVARGESLSRDEILGQNVWTMLPRHAAAIFQQKCNEAARARKTVTFEARSPQNDHWMRVHAYPFEGGLSVYCQDVTSQKQVAAKLAYRADLLDNVDDAVIATDEYLRVTFWNVAAERLYGWASDEVVGRDLWDLVLEFSADERARALQTLEETGQLRTDATTRTKDGVAIHVEGNTIALRGESPAHNDPITGYLSLRRNVAERKDVEDQLRRSEAYLAAGQRISNTGSWAWNQSTGEMFWSLEHYRICGVDPATFEVTVESAFELIHPDDRLSARQALNEAARNRQRFARELRILRPDGTVREVRSVADPSFNATGDVTEYVGTVMDVTQRNKEKGARQELLRRLMVAQEDERRRISRELHDAVGQHLGLLTLGLAKLRLHRWTQGSSDELASLEKIVDDLDGDLDFFVWQLRPTALDDLGLVGAIRDHVSRWSDHLGIRVDWHVSGVEDASLTEEIQITVYRLLQEALNNVAKHAEAKHVDVLLERYGDHLSLIVEDDGIGFEAGRLFGAEHTGLGLIGMRERAALVGGSVDIESHVGDGTTFVARIPIRGAAP